MAFFLLKRRPPRPTTTDPLLPYTTLCRANGGGRQSARAGIPRAFWRLGGWQRNVGSAELGPLAGRDESERNRRAAGREDLDQGSPLATSRCLPTTRTWLRSGNPSLVSRIGKKRDTRYPSVLHLPPSPRRRRFSFSPAKNFPFASDVNGPHLCLEQVRLSHRQYQGGRNEKTVSNADRIRAYPDERHRLGPGTATDRGPVDAAAGSAGPAHDGLRHGHEPGNDARSEEHTSELQSLM